MKAHKVPATYYSGWEISTLPDRMYLFYKNDTSKQGICKRYRGVNKITAEHSYFMEEDFYYIDFSVEGIAFKLEDEITDFLNNNNLIIKCDDDLSDDATPSKVLIDDYQKFMSYRLHIDSWEVSDINGQVISNSDFQTSLNNYIFDKVGKLIEETYFANYLENMWPEIRNSIKTNIANLNSGDNVILDKKLELLEFFVIQYLRLDKRIKTDIQPFLDFFSTFFKKEMQVDAQTISEMKKDGLLSPEPYFFGILLDTARGDKTKINNHIDEIDKNYYIDVLETPAGYSFLTSTSPCIFSKIVNLSKEEMLFPINNTICLRFRKKHLSSECGKYIMLSAAEIKTINNCIISNSDDVVISESEYINHLI